MQVVDIPVGAEGDVKVSFSQGVFSVVAGENTPGLTAGLTLNLPVTYFVDALAAKLGGTPTELAVAAMIDSVLKGIA